MQQQTRPFHTVGPKTRADLAARFSIAARNAQGRALRARAMGNLAGWVMHMDRASQLAHKADLLGG
jgi:hypothetical protein